MLTIQQLDLQNKSLVQQFLKLPFRIYAHTPQWVPPFNVDVSLMLNKNKHPFYEHSDADFFYAEEGGRIVGRIAVLENRSFNQYHHTKKANFYLFECEDNPEAAHLLFERCFDWARKRGLEEIVGPKGFSAFDGYGILTQGFDQRQMMNMANYNLAYYPALVEANGFETEVDFLDFYANAADFHMPEKVHQIVERVLQRGTFKVHQFKSKSDLRAWAPRIGRAYNECFVNNWEYYPFTEREIKFMIDNLITAAVPRLMKIITHEERLVGFSLGFPDVSLAMQRARGSLNPISIVDLLLELRRSKWISMNGGGILPEFQGRGGNALLYVELEKSVREMNFEHVELTQNADTAAMMRQDILRMGAKVYKVHRVYRCKL
jgi:hypothetical protein